MGWFVTNKTKAEKLFNEKKYKEAEPLFNRAVQNGEKYFGKNHKDTLTSKIWLAQTLCHQGKYQEAERMCYQVIEGRERTLGKVHDHTLSSKDILAHILYRQEKYQEAERIYIETAHDWERAYDKDNSRTLNSKSCLAAALYHQRKYQEAQKIFQEVFDAREVTLGNMHADTVASNQWLLRTKLAVQQESKKTGSPFDMIVHGQEKTSTFFSSFENQQNQYKSPSNQSSVQTKLSEEQDEAEKRLRETIQGRDAFLGKKDSRTLDFKLKLGQLLLDRNRHQEARSIFQEVEHIREEILGKQSPARSVSPARSQLLAHNTPARSQGTQSSTRSLPIAHEATDKPGVVESPMGSQSLLHDTTAISRDRLSTFFLAPTGSRQPYNDSEISQISTLLRHTNSAWSHVPRTYIILRTIDCLHHLDELISLEFSDYCLPVNQGSVPGCLSPKMRSLFLDSQKLILTQSMDLEKGAEGHHCHFEKGESLPFESKGILGSGGYGQVDRILSHISFREYARKRVPRKSAFGGRGVGALKGIIGEIEAMKKLKHRHIVEFVGSYTDPKYLSVIMRPVAEQDLSVYLRKAGSANHAEMRTFFGCLTAGLQFLHDRQIRHKDIKPGNILVDKGRIYLTDFGMSLDFEDATGSTTVGMVNGMTPRYCAPEVALLEPRNTSSDIWSLGVIFLEIVVVLKGRTIEWMDDFLRAHGSQQTFVRLNPSGLEKLLVELKQTASLSDNVALVWIQQILQEQHRSRPTAASLATLITQPYSHGRPETIFCGICCLQGSGDADSDSSDDLETEDFLRGFALRTRIQ